MTKELPEAKYQGVLPIAGVELDCAVLDDGRRILTATSIFTALGRSRKGMNERLEIDGTKIPPFLAAKNLEPYIDQAVINGITLIEYQDGKTKNDFCCPLLV